MKNLSAFSKQLLGAVAGMAIAAILYVGIDQVSLSNIQGYLVNPGENITENAGQVSVNSKVVDPDTLRRIASRAQSVANQLGTAATDTGTPQTAINQNVELRKAVRLGDKELAATNANPVEYVGNIAAPVSEQERLQQRTARTVAAMQAGDAGQPVYVSRAVATSSKPLQTIVAALPGAQRVEAVPESASATASAPAIPEPTFVEPAIPEAAPAAAVPEVRSRDNLPQSGPALNILLILSALGAFAILRPDIKDRFIAMMRLGS